MPFELWWVEKFMLPNCLFQNNVLKYRILVFVFFTISLGFSPGFSAIAQQTQWVKQISGKETTIQPYGLFPIDVDRNMLVFKSDGDFGFERKSIKNNDTSQIRAIIIHNKGEITIADSVPAEFMQNLAALQGNQWLLRSRERNGNYYLAYGPSTPLRLPNHLSWNLAFLDVNGHRLWEIHLPENRQISRLEMLNNGQCLLVGSEELPRGDKDFFFSIWNEYGQELMFRSFGSKSDDEARSAGYDAEGNIFLGGYFSADSSFLGNTADLSGAEKDGFVAGYSSDGKQKFFYRQRGQGFCSVDFLQVTPLGKVLFVTTLKGKDWKLPPFGVVKKGKQDLVIGLFDPKLKPESDSPLQIFPNPARELVYFGLNQDFGKGKLQATLHQKDGTVLQKMQIGSSGGSTFRFNVSNTQPGAYFISLQGKAGKITGRVVVE